jgi:hypothetical protein
MSKENRKVKYQNIYFIDHSDNSINSISYFHKSQNSPLIIKENRKHKVIFTSLGFYNETLYWVEQTEKMNELKMNSTYPVSLDKETDRTITDVVVKAPQIGWSKCLIVNKCDHFCVTKPADSTRLGPQFDSECVCPSHFDHRSPTDVNSITCRPPTNFLLFGRQNSISRMNFDMEKEQFWFDQILSIKNVNSPSALSWDNQNRRIYWLEGSKGKIMSSDESGGDSSTVPLNSGNGIRARDFDIYFPDSLIYWSNAPNNSIQFAKITKDGLGIMRGDVVSRSVIINYAAACK